MTRFLIVGGSGVIHVPPSQYGGIEREAHWLAVGLADRGHKIGMIAKTDSTCPYLVGGGENEFEFAEAAQKLIGDYDVIIDMSHDKVVCQQVRGIPFLTVWQVMSVGFPYNPVFISKAQRHRCGFDDNAPVVYYGIGVNEYPLFTGNRDPYLLYMGSLIREKRVHWVAELAQRLGMRCKVAGPSWDSDYWPVLDKMREMPHVEFVGDVGGAEKLELLQKAHCLVHPVGDLNWTEAGAIAVIEALMVGTPVIASTNGCLPEYIVDFHNGFTCASLNEMEQVYKWLDKVKPINCRESVVHYYTKERMAEDYEKLAERVISGETW